VQISVACRLAFRGAACHRLYLYSVTDKIFQMVTE